MQHLLEIPLDPPITLILPDNRRGPQEITMESLQLHFLLNYQTQTIHAQIAGLPQPVLLYSRDDYHSAAADTPDEHAARLLYLLGTDLPASLSLIATGQNLPAPPPRIPREIANWRARAILELQGLLPTVEALITAMTGPEGIVVRNAWAAGAPLARHGPTVTALSPQLGLTSDQIDSMFIAAAALEV